MGRRFRRRRYVVALATALAMAVLELGVPVGCSIPGEELQLSPLVFVMMKTLLRVTAWGTS